MVPYLRVWLRSLYRRPRVFVEPFAGGAITGLTVAAEGLARQVVLCELDEGVAAVWETILGGDHEWLVERILSFPINRDRVISTLNTPARSRREVAFQTLLRNRVHRGGILAPGATLVKNGENGKGVASRWYPETLANRIRAIASLNSRITFVRGDGLELVRRYCRQTSAAIFADPPYTAGGKRAGRRLYAHNEIDHEKLFDLMSKARGAVMLTYDESEEVRRLAGRYKFQVEEVPMKNAHHAVMRELVITNFGSCLDLTEARRQAAFLVKSLNSRRGHHATSGDTRAFRPQA